MILGIGIDSVEIERFSKWDKYNQKQLLRIFSSDEISYSMTIPAKMAERLAARFAAKEAFLKALSATIPNHGLSLLTISKNVCVIRLSGQAPILQVNWDALRTACQKAIPENIVTHISITHTKTMAISFVLCEK